MTTRRKHAACWIPKVTNRHSEYVILIAFPLQQRLVVRTRPIATLYEHGLSCFLLFSKWDDTKSCGIANSKGSNIPARYDTQARSTHGMTTGRRKSMLSAQITHTFDRTWSSKTDHLNGGTTRPMHQARISTHHRDAYLRNYTWRGWSFPYCKSNLDRSVTHTRYNNNNRLLIKEWRHATRSRSFWPSARTSRYLTVGTN